MLKKINVNFTDHYNFLDFFYKYMRAHDCIPGFNYISRQVSCAVQRDYT